MKKYKKKSVVVEAEQYKEYGQLVKGMCNSTSCLTAGNNKPHVHTIHDNQIVLLEVGDYIIPEPDGEHFYPCKPDIFAQTYELAIKEASQNKAKDTETAIQPRQTSEELGLLLSQNYNQIMQAQGNILAINKELEKRRSQAKG